MESLRRIYQAAGYGLGHRVAILFEQRPEFVFHYYALNALGCSVVPINPDYRRDEIRYVTLWNTRKRASSLVSSDDCRSCRHSRASSVERAEDLPGAVERALANRPALLDVVVSTEARSSDGKTGLAWVPDLQPLAAWDEAERTWRES
jgi:acyl-CoA synthetase (AMP-forming)/AMP-acid ligase II